MINHKAAQPSICRGGLFYSTFIIQLGGERIFKIGEHLAKLEAKG